jgi:hypothetical protein
MESASALKAVEVLGVLAAGGLFVWWQFRDLRREREKSSAARHAVGQAVGHAAGRAVARVDAAPDKQESAS